jgi:MSHA biogenesis protein MshO
MVIAITGAGRGGGAFIVPPVQAYLPPRRAPTWRTRPTTPCAPWPAICARPLANSVRVTPDQLSLELIPTTSAALYQTEGTGALVFGSVATSFNLIGPA